MAESTKMGTDFPSQPLYVECHTPNLTYEIIFLALHGKKENLAAAGMSSS